MIFTEEIKEYIKERILVMIDIHKENNQALHCHIIEILKLLVENDYPT